MSLLEQWEERIKTFIPDARIGKIIQKTYDIEDKDFVIASLQTIISKNKNFNKSNFKQFGLCIYDECHHISAPSFYKCIPIISSFYTLGLSATPDRKDGLEQIFYNFIGDIGYKEDKKLYSVVPTIENIDYDNSDKITIKKLRFSDRVDFNNLIKQIIEDNERNELICNLVKECIEENDKRQILLVSHRILQIKKLYKMINKLFDKEICGLYIGGLKKEKLEESSKKQVIIATYNIMSEGVDIPTLNTLIYATPTKDIQQVSGRILRKDTGIEHKIIDIIDNISIFKNQFRSRYNFYKKHYL